MTGMRWMIVVATILAGCSTEPGMDNTGTQAEQRRGKTYHFEFHGYAVQCAGTPSSLDKCFEKAAGLCGAKGYVIHQIQKIEGDARMKSEEGKAIPTMVILISCK
jgi:hypothetical protein